MKASTELSKEEIDYYSRQIVFRDIGYEGQLRLKNAKVCLVGLGGLGSPIAIQLAAMGIGFLRIIDRDVIELSNLQRQYLYGKKFIGYPKAEIATKRLKELNPYIKIEPLAISLNEGNAEELLSDVDLVIDGLDRVDGRYAINRACVKFKIPYVFGAVITTFGYVSTIIPDKTPCLECFYGGLDDEELATCSTLGVHPSILGIIASVQVSEAIRMILGKEPRLMNKIFHCDIESLAFDEIKVTRVDVCSICSKNPRRPPKHLNQKLIEEVCSRSGKRTFIVNPKENLELPLEKLVKVLEQKGFKIGIKAKLGLTFDYNDKTIVNILKSGIAIIEGMENKQKALELYENLITKYNSAR
ncbi:HesA/MoeB/ThiF family protein [[Eubacterium] cellulosolvens]